jgi:hypothetical protein
MSTGGVWARRRRDYARGVRDDHAVGATAGKPNEELLRQWRRMLTRMEGQAGRYRLGEVEMLLGVVGLALEDAIKSSRVP